MRDSYRNSELVPPLYVVDGNQDDDKELTIAEVTVRGVELGRFMWRGASWDRIGATPYASIGGLWAMLAAVESNPHPGRDIIGTGDGVTKIRTADEAREAFGPESIMGEATAAVIEERWDAPVLHAMYVPPRGPKG